MIKGIERPKYTNSCITKLIIPKKKPKHKNQSRSRQVGIFVETEPVARVSFLHHAYHVAHNFSGTDRWVLTSDIALYIPLKEVEVSICVILFLKSYQLGIPPMLIYIFVGIKSRKDWWKNQRWDQEGHLTSRREREWKREWNKVEGQMEVFELNLLVGGRADDTF